MMRSQERFGHVQASPSEKTTPTHTSLEIRPWPQLHTVSHSCMMGGCRVRDFRKDGVSTMQARIPAALFASVALAASAGEWKELFNGRDLDGWMSSTKGPPVPGWVVENGVLKRADKAGYIWTRERFGDFELELEYRTEGNSGVFIRTDNPADPVQTGIEVQIDKPSEPSRHSVGALYDLVAPSRNAAQPGWNRLNIIARGPRIEVRLNGHLITEMDLDRWTVAGQNPDGSKNKFKKPLKEFAREGHVGFQDHGAVVEFRNIRIRTLD